jgi:hypothetical protein
METRLVPAPDVTLVVESDASSHKDNPDIDVGGVFTGRIAK